MHNIEDDFFHDSDDDIGLTFKQIEKQQTSKYLQSLIDINDKLYEPNNLNNKISTSIPNNLLNNGLDSNFNYKYYSEGYDATHDLVDDKEIQQWKNHFQYLRVIGIGINSDMNNNIDNLSSNDNHIIEMNTDRYVEDIHNNINSYDNESLCIIGKTVTIHKSTCFNSNMEEDEEGELICKHGVLEDYIIYNNEDKYQEVRMKSNQTNTTSLEEEEDSSIIPLISKKEEIISSIMDLLWPTVVDTLKPLIKNVLEVATIHNIPYRDDNNNNNTIDNLNKQDKYKNDNKDINEFHHDFQDLW